MGKSSDLDLHQLTPAVGAIIRGADLNASMDAQTITFIRTALLNHGVIFFRQQDVGAEQMWAFLKHFGTPQKDDSFGTDADGPDDVREADLKPTRKGTAVWHADSTFLAKPPKFTLLRAVKLPPCGGDTCWASMAAAYDALSEPVRAMVDKLSAVHAVETALARLDDYGDVFADKFTTIHAPQQVHPVVQVHPETGRKALFVTESSTARIVGLEPVESRHLLAMLFEHIKSPDFAMRWCWTPGDVAMWDNRIVQHYAVPDYDSERVMQRIVVAGERPCGPQDTHEGSRRTLVHS
jgi:taurine dioxygenase